MADQGLWFKLWCAAPDDPHISNLSLEDFARWCLLGVYMKVHGNGGILTIPIPARALQNILRCISYEEVILTLKKFPNCDAREEGKRATDDIVALRVEWKNWSKYQGDYSTIRSQRWRDRQRFKRRGEEKRGEEKEKRSIPSSPKGEVASLIKVFHSKLTEALKEQPTNFNGGVLGRLFKAALKSHTGEEIRARANDWFASTDPFIVANGFSPTLFASKFTLLKGGPIHAPNYRASGGYIGVEAPASKYAKITANREDVKGD